MNPALAAERPQLQTAVSQQIAELTCELISLEPEVERLERSIVRRAEIQQRIAFLQDLEASYERMP